MWHITTFYRFTPLAEDTVSALVEAWREALGREGVVGTLLLATEGVNGTLAGSEAVMEAVMDRARADFGGEEVRFKNSVAEAAPFRKLVVEPRSEIVTMKRPDLVPDRDENRHLSAEEWHAWIESDRPKVVLDTRNRYETFAGKFRGAVDPGLDRFSDFKAYLEKGEVPKDVPVLIYCTGGIRCEKAILEMEAQGYHEVYQLRDGILGYLEQFPEGAWEGECFVFDDRIAVDSQLQPTRRYTLCAKCGATIDRRQTASVGEAERLCCNRCTSSVTD